MKRQSGFTLIELLLVLAIIGIISAIAIPALLGQRSRARDKSAIQNAVSRVGDLVGQWDKGREAGTAAATIITDMGTYLTNTSASDVNPWAGTTGAPTAPFNTTIAVAGNDRHPVPKPPSRRTARQPPSARCSLATSCRPPPVCRASSVPRS
ncbi:MAG: prepilin-type N-terminal cleavage/methylation domain-containing protein [Holophagaceae bacterium]|nr:prepilin-type N-terminal cleavage/methylation domain-containing protein [Holophagaceae bacterium]